MKAWTVVNNGHDIMLFGFESNNTVLAFWEDLTGKFVTVNDTFKVFLQNSVDSILGFAFTQVPVHLLKCF